MKKNHRSPHKLAKKLGNKEEKDKATLASTKPPEVCAAPQNTNHLRHEELEIELREQSVIRDQQARKLEIIESARKNIEVINRSFETIRQCSQSHQAQRVIEESLNKMENLPDL